MAMMYNNLDSIHVELTNRCNAACPQCPRTGAFPKGLSKAMHEWGFHDMPVQWFDEILTSRYGATIRKIIHCGNFGDPMMHPQALDVFQLCDEYGIQHQSIDTNGSLRTPDYWKEIAKLKSVTVNFSIDGLADTNHIYRKNTSFDKIIENARAFIEAGGKAYWIMLAFAHNEHQIEECRQLSKDMGFDTFQVRATTRLYDPDKPMTPKTQMYRKKQSDEIKRDKLTLPSNPEYQADTVKEGLIEKDIECMSVDKREVYISADGLVTPCCWTGTQLIHEKYDPRNSYDFGNWMFDRDIKHDMRQYDFDTIIESYISQYGNLQEQFVGRCIETCNRKCGSNHQNRMI